MLNKWQRYMGIADLKQLKDDHLWEEYVVGEIVLEEEEEDAEVVEEEGEVVVSHPKHP